MDRALQRTMQDAVAHREPARLNVRQDTYLTQREQDILRECVGRMVAVQSAINHLHRRKRTRSINYMEEMDKLHA